MIQSAYILPLNEVFPWGRAKPYVQSDGMSVVNLPVAVDVAAYRRRDQELSFRDIIMASLVAKIAIKAGEVWQFKASRPVLPAVTDAELEAVAADTAPVSVVGAVDHVENSSVPKDGIATDRQLYARDVTLYEALRSICDIYGLEDLAQLAEVGQDDAWSIADGIAQKLACVGFNIPLSVKLLKDPDCDLAERDNQLATYVAQLQEALSGLFARATRVYLQSGAAEPETYALLSDSVSERIWSAFPQLPGRRLQVVYDKAEKTITWLAEDPVSSSSVPAAQDFYAGTGTANAVPTIPAPADSEFFRQKSARLMTTPSVDRLLYQTTNPELFVIAGGVYQPDAVLMTTPGAAVFSLPLIVPAGATRIGLAFVLSRYATVLGFMNRTRQYDRTAVTLAVGIPVYFDIDLPAGRSKLNFVLTDKVQATPSFYVSVTVSSQGQTTLAFDGSFVFNQAPGTAVATQQLEVISDGGTTTIAVTLASGSGQLTINQLDFELLAQNLATLDLSVQLGSQTIPLVQLQEVLERPAVVLFDFVVASEMVTPNLGVTWIGGGGACLYIRAYDVRTFEAQNILPDAAAYDPHKSSLAFSALACVQDAFDVATKLGAVTEPGRDTAGKYVLSRSAYDTWISNIEQGGEARIRDAFELACPGDIGRPAIVPAGLENGTVATAGVAKKDLAPTYKTLQPWMLEFLPLVAGPSFWPPQTLISSAQYLPAAGFSYAVEPSGADIMRIVAVYAVSQMENCPDANLLVAFTAPNAGPGGGSVVQTTTVFVSIAALYIGASYTLVLTYAMETLAGVSLGTGSIVDVFAATATTTVRPFGPLEAPSGQKWSVTSCYFDDTV